MLSFLQSLFSPPIDTIKEFEFQYRTEYGPFLKKDPINTSEPFYDYLGKKAKQYLTKNSVVLEVGCGMGRLSIDLANIGAKEVIGTDTNTIFLDEAKAIAGNHRNNVLSYPCQGSYQFIFADVQNLPFADKFFSLALCINVIDRIVSPQKAISELHRVLQKNGVLLLCDPYDWVDRFTPKENQVEDMKELLQKNHWQILFEKTNLPYLLQIKPRRQTLYQNHLLILQKK